MFNWIEPSGPNKVRLPYPEPPAEGNTPSLATFDFAEEIEAITYIRNDNTINNELSNEYVDACYENLKSFWNISKNEFYEV